MQIGDANTASQNTYPMTRIFTPLFRLQPLVTVARIVRQALMKVLLAKPHSLGRRAGQLVVSTALLCLCSMLGLQAQTRQVQHPFNFSTQFEDVYVAQGDRGFAVGDCGILASTLNGGLEWKIASSPEGREYSSVICQSGTNCQTVLLAGSGYYARSTNAGLSWTVTEAASWSNPQLEEIGNNQIMASVSPNYYLQSADGGASWTQVNLPAEAGTPLFFANPMVAFYFHRVSNTDYQLYKTTNAGQTWLPTGYSNPSYTRHLSFASPSIGFLYDNDRNLRKTSNGGQSWTIVPQTQLPFNLTLIVALSETELRGVSVTDQVYESHDGGLSWTTYAIDQGDGVFVKSNYHRRGSEFWLVSNASEIYYTAANFTNFHSQIMGDRVAMEAVVFESEQTGYAFSRFSIYKTTNAGEDWLLFGQAPDNTSIRNAYILADGRLLLCTSSEPKVSSDGGNTFSNFLPASVVAALEGQSLDAMSILADGRYIFAANQKVVYSNSQGSGWQVVNHELNSRPQDIYFYNTQVGFIAGSGAGRLIKTTDGGLSWQLPTNFPTSQPINTFHFTSPTEGIVFGGSTSYRTTDGGNSWQSNNSLPGAYEVSRANNGDLYVSEFASGNKNATWRSQDNGQSWQQLGQGCAPIRANALTPNNRYYFAVGDGGLIERYDIDLVNDVRSPPPSAIRPILAFPNPTSGELNIQLPLANSPQNVAVSIFTLQGQLQEKRLYNQEATTLSFSIGHLPKGIYLLRLQGAGWAQSGRVVLQ